MWTIASSHTDQVFSAWLACLTRRKVYAMVKAEIERRSLSESQKQNYLSLIDLYITNSSSSSSSSSFPLCSNKHSNSHVSSSA